MGSIVGVACAEGVGLGLAAANQTSVVETSDPAGVLRALDAKYNLRWTWWGLDTRRLCAAHDIAIDRCWDVLAVHRLIHGGWRWSVAEVWASLHDLSPDEIPELGQLDLLGTHPLTQGAAHEPLQVDGHIRPEWVGGTWRSTPVHVAAWAGLVYQAATRQQQLLASFDDPGRAVSNAHAESAASLLCAELEVHGLPVHVPTALDSLEALIGPRPQTTHDDDEHRARRDAAVLDHLDPPQPVNLRNNDDVRSMLRRLDITVSDTRAWRLEQVRDQHPVVDALLHWRKAERIATTYGYRWLDEHVRHGRLRGEWSSSDGSAGRMTASAGLHNLPADMRSSVIAEPGHVFVRADLGQVEPRVLASVSGDASFIEATKADDLYAEVALQLAVSRHVAKLAVLGAMYGATTGESAHALRRLEAQYPRAMGFLESAATSGQERRDLRTVGGRLIRLSTSTSSSGDLDAARSAAASRGRYARNAVIQGAAAEFFKIWAIVVRRRIRAHDARIVLCLHDELLVHTPTSAGERVSQIVSEAVDEAAHYWSPHPGVRFVADITAVERWADAKD